MVDEEKMKHLYLSSAVKCLCWLEIQDFLYGSLMPMYLENI
jgi:hypothetical protein